MRLCVRSPSRPTFATPKPLICTYEGRKNTKRQKKKRRLKTRSKINDESHRENVIIKKTKRWKINN